jgi:hypothetical protein
LNRITFGDQMSSNENQFSLITKDALPAGEVGILRFTYRPASNIGPGAKLWFIYDIRQDAGSPQCEHQDQPNHVSAELSSGQPVGCEGFGARTLDYYPVIPEFLHVCEITLHGGMDRGDELTINLGSESGPWRYSQNPIGEFRFWLVESKDAGQTFLPTGYKTYRKFAPRVDPDAPEDQPLYVNVSFTGEYPPFAPENTRKTPGILWGEIHGMVFNQRPLDDYYRYARDVAKYDFAAAMLFSYNTCVGNMWDYVRDTADKFTVPGEFVGISGVEFGTPPDGSHRNAHFFHHVGVPPIFFEERPPALEEQFTRRFHPDTVFCGDMDHFYETVKQFGGIVTGHFHTLEFHREILGELWQKQRGSGAEEERTFNLLNQGMRLGIVCGSDTHDSMPGNPAPEPGCPQTAGFMAVLSNEPTRESIHQAILDRRVYGTTGARIALYLDVSDNPMGSILPLSTPRTFRLSVEGSTAIEKVDLIRDGLTIGTEEPDGNTWEGELTDTAGDASHWYVLRVTQSDGHRAWSSPIWFE